MHNLVMMNKIGITMNLNHGIVCIILIWMIIIRSYTLEYISQSIDPSIINSYIKYYLKDLSPYRQAILVLVHEYVNLK